MDLDTDKRSPFADMAEKFDSKQLHEQLVTLTKDITECNMRLISLFGVLIQKVENIEKNFYGYSDYMTVNAPVKEMAK